MCTAVLSIEPGQPVLLAGVRDEFADRAWQPPGRHWPEYPDLIGGRDLLAGGTWLAVAPLARRASCVLNGRGSPAPADARRSRGELPLRAAAGQPPDAGLLAGYDPFHLLTVAPAQASMQSWDGSHLVIRQLGPGLHFVTNGGLAAELADAAEPARAELARAAYFLPRLAAADRPVPLPGVPAARAWGAWLPLINGAGLPPDDQRALVVRRALPGARAWGTTSISLVSLAEAAVRYDFTAKPGDPDGWQEIS